MSPRTQELPLSNNLKISDHSNMSIPFTCFFSIIIACSLVIVYPWHRHTFATLSFVAEIFIFLYVGMDALDIEKWRVVSSRYSETRVDISKSKQYPMICNYIIGGLCIYLEIVVMLFFFLICSAQKDLFLLVRVYWYWFWSAEQPLFSLCHLCPTWPRSINMRKSALSSRFELKIPVSSFRWPSFTWPTIYDFAISEFADYNLVGWSNARCCFHGSCLQPGKNISKIRMLTLYCA